jgi:Ca2+-transporting ATPase
MDSLAALALATEKPTGDLLNRKPESKKDRLITPLMWKMILAQAFLQVAVGLSLLYGGNQIFYGGDMSALEKRELKTLVFNTFVFMQLFNLIK